MGAWLIVIISVLAGVVANEQPPNPPYLLEELKATAESRVLARVEHLLQSLSAKIKVLDDGIGEMKRDINSLYLARNESIKSMENVSDQLKNISISATQRMTEQEHKLERLHTEVIRDISSIFLVHKEMYEMLKTTNKSFTQRVMNLEQKLERLPQIMLDTNEMIKTTNESFTQWMKKLEHKLELPLGHTGVYLMQPDPSENITFEVFRDWTTSHIFGGDWIVFQRRFNGSVDFYRNWTEYKDGFGDLRGEHWLGLDKLHAIVKSRRHELLIVLEDFDGAFAYAHYDNFKIGGESEKYIIKSVGSYTGTAGDSFTYHKDELFTTYDQDNDKSSDSNCAKTWTGAWWFYRCYASHLNGKYLEGRLSYNGGIAWQEWQGFNYSLKSTKMMVRPVA